MEDFDIAPSKIGESAQRVVDRAIAEKRWKTVVTHDDRLGHGLQEHYVRDGAPRAKPFKTRTGWNVSFRGVWHPRPAGEAAPPPAEAPAIDVAGEEAEAQ